MSLTLRNIHFYHLANCLWCPLWRNNMCDVVSSMIELVWLISLPASLLAISAIRKSKPGQLQLFQLTIALACIVPITVTIINDSYFLWEVLTGQAVSQHQVLGQPFILVWTFVQLLCLAVHLGEILISRTLIKAWAPRHSKRQ